MIFSRSSVSLLLIRFLFPTRYVTVNEIIGYANTLDKSKQTSLSRHHSHAYLSHCLGRVRMEFPTSSDLSRVSVT